MDTHVMRMVKSWWSTWGDGQPDQAALVALADGIHRLIREAEADTRRQHGVEENGRISSVCIPMDEIAEAIANYPRQ